jgi:hypothetical protein
VLEDEWAQARWCGATEVRCCHASRMPLPVP